MTAKPDRTPADLKCVDQSRAERAVENLPSTEGEISALASAGAPFIFFDAVSFCSIDSGVAGVTLSASRQIANLPGNQVASDRVLVAHLRAPLPTMLALRATIDDIERMAKRQIEAAQAAAAEAEPPGRLPH